MNRLVLCLLAILTLAPVSGALDLCACSDAGHGLFCEDEEAAVESCCSAPEESSHEEGGCECPVVDLDLSTPKVELADGPALATLTLLGKVTLCLGLVPTEAPRFASVEPRPPPLRRHLLLSVMTV